MKYLFTSFALFFLFCHSYGQDNLLLSKSIEKIVKKYNVTGLQVALILDGAVIYNSEFGYANLAANKMVDSETAFRIASISKTITATAIMQLYEQGKISLDEDISRYLGYKVRNPKYPDDKITIRMLANHVSGLNDGWGYDDFLNATYSEKIPDIKELILPGGNFYTKDMWKSYKPAGGYVYCNCGYGLLGTIIEKVSGERFDIYCRKHIFEPLEMKSSFNVDDVDIKNLAALYRNSIAQYDAYGLKKEPRDLSRYVTGTNAAAFSPQGGLRTSALDLAKFLLMHMNKGSWNNKKILDDTTALTAHNYIFPYRGWKGLNFGSGVSFYFTQSLLKGQTLIGHAGGAYGLVSGMYFDKNRRYGIIFFANGGNYGPDENDSNTFERTLMAVMYDYIRPKLSIENEIFTDIDLLKNMPKDIFRMPKIKK